MTPLTILASRLNLPPDYVWSELRTAIIPKTYNAWFNNQKSVKQVSDDMCYDFIRECNNYELDPFKSLINPIVRGGKLKGELSVDGYILLLNRQPNYDGVSFQEDFDQAGKIFAITCTIHRKDLSVPISIKEYFSENNDPKSEIWKEQPIRMLRHRAMKQGVRYSFGAEIRKLEEKSEIKVNILEKSRDFHEETKIVLQSEEENTTKVQLIIELIKEVDNMNVLKNIYGMAWTFFKDSETLQSELETSYKARKAEIQ